MFILGAAYALRTGAHIRTDFFWEGWSWRTREPLLWPLKATNYKDERSRR